MTWTHGILPRKWNFRKFNQWMDPFDPHQQSERFNAIHGSFSVEYSSARCSWRTVPLLWLFGWTLRSLRPSNFVNKHRRYVEKRSIASVRSSNDRWACERFQKEQRGFRHRHLDERKSRKIKEKSSTFEEAWKFCERCIDFTYVCCCSRWSRRT